MGGMDAAIEKRTTVMSRTPVRPFEKVFLHVGLPKTGTTSIQQSLLVNRNTLATEGVFIPRFEQPGAEFGTTNASLFLDAVLVEPLSERRKLVHERNLAVFQQEINNRSREVKTLILSGETLSMWSETALRQFMKWGTEQGYWDKHTRFELLYVVRNFVEWFRKIAEQRLLNAPESDDLNELRLHMRQQVLAFVSGARTVFGQECLTFRSYEKLRASDGGLLQGFSDWLGMPLVMQQFDANPTRTYEVLRLLKALGPKWPNRQIFANKLGHLPGLNPAWSEKMGQEMELFWLPVAEQWTAQTGCQVPATPEGELDLSKPELWSPIFLESLEEVVLEHVKWRNRCDELRGAFERIIQEEGSQWASESLARVQDFMRRLEANS